MRINNDLRTWPIIRWWPWQKVEPFTKNNSSYINDNLALPKYFFKTKRLVFRPLTQKDLFPLLKIVSKPEVVAHVDDGLPMDEELVKRWIEFSRRTIAEHGSGTGALVSRSKGKIVGWAGLSRPHNEPPEIVYGLDNRYWRKGYGLEIASALVKWCEDDLSMKEVRATVYPENIGSIRILEKLGFVYSANLPNENGPFSHLYIRNDY